MNGGSEGGLAIVVLILGGAVILSIGARRLLERWRLPPMVAFIVIGLALRSLQSRAGVVPSDIEPYLALLGKLGLITLLVHVGMRSDVRGLLDQLPRASGIWGADVAVSFALGFAGAWLLGLPTVERLFVATALTATSIGVSVDAWNEAGALDSDEGRTLLDVAELDDISAVLLMAVLFGLAPSLMSGEPIEALPTLGTVGLLLVKLALFAAGCWVFAQFVERRVTALFGPEKPGPEPLVAAIGIAAVIAALAGAIGFSIAIGALFAGLAFSRDREALSEKIGFTAIDDLLSPFFFIHLGYSIDPTLLGGALLPGLTLLAAAVLGKTLGVVGASLFTTGLGGAALLGVSMVPRAEIAMVVAQQGRESGIVSDTTFAGLVFVVAATGIAVPVVLRPWLSRRPPS